MSYITEAKNGMKLEEHLDTGKFRTVLVPFWHGVGDVVMVLPIIARLRELYPAITFSLGLCNGLDQEVFVPDAVLLDGDWREKALTLGYDLVFPVNFPLERMDDLTKTKAEVCCEEEIGIPPVCGQVRRSDVSMHVRSVGGKRGRGRRSPDLERYQGGRICPGGD
jgi:hypothetical protein